MLLITVDELKEKTASFYSFYHLEGIEEELELWHKIWKDKKLSSEELKDLVVSQVLKETEPFFPSTKKVLMILLSQPCTTSTIEHSFSTLRRIKTWLRSTMEDDRLNGLAMMSVHRKFVPVSYTHLRAHETPEH